MTQPIDDKPEYPGPPLSPHFRGRPRHRWVLFLFVLGVIALLGYVGWVIIRAWMEYVKGLT